MESMKVQKRLDQSGEKKKTKNACNFTCMRFFVLFYKAGYVLLYDDFIRK